MRGYWPASGVASGAGSVVNSEVVSGVGVNYSIIPIFSYVKGSVFNIPIKYHPKVLELIKEELSAYSSQNVFLKLFCFTNKKIVPLFIRNFFNHSR